ncbi:MAG: DUF4185 domain-containing protein [Bythopirellula sp.]|nr:DUF4185 domain-containing protein [Bythopirellula sp.]
MLIGTVLVHAPRVMAETTDSTLVLAVRYLGKQFQDNPVRVTGQDCASSIVLPSGEAFWLFGDTIEGPFESIRGLALDDKLSNTAAVVPEQDVSEGIKRFEFVTEPDGKRARQVVPFVDGEAPAEQRIWPVHGACSGGHIYVFYHRISLIPGVDVFENFTLEGMGIARAKIGEWKFERLTAPDSGYEFWKGDKPTFGVFVQQQDGVAYVWGSLMTGMFLARTSPEKIADLSSYEYLIAAPTTADPEAKPVWSKTFEPMAVMFDSVPNEMSASYNSHLGCYTAIHTRLRENEIVLRTAPEIVGPWSDAEVIYRPEKKDESDLFYAAKEHPELARENGKVIYVTYVDSRSYAPQLIEVTLK